MKSPATSPSEADRGIGNAATEETPAVVAADQQWVARQRPAIADADARLAARFDQGGGDAANAGIEKLLSARTALLDGIVRDAWQHCMGMECPLALFAVGGYGRGELFPQSDLDLLVFAEGDLQGAHAASLARFFTLLWDTGLPVGHAVRSAQQTIDAAGADITVMTSLLDARLLAGSTEAVDRLAEVVATPDAWPADRYFQAKREELQQRHARFGDTADNLEPNIKDGPGGLRDLQTLRWMAKRVAGVPNLAALVPLGQLGADEHDTLRRERLRLSRLRWGLHLVAGKREERLRFDYQKPLAQRLGHDGDVGNLAVEQMMQEFYRSAAVVQRLSDRLLQRFEEQLEGEADPQPVDVQFELRRGYIAARVNAWPASMDDVFALFQVWARDRDIRGLHSQTARALAEALPQLPSFDQASDAQRHAFMDLLRGPRPVRSMERMARLGVLGRWLPAFARVSGRMQFDLFHAYTVDQHTLAVLRNIARFASGKHDERFAITHDVWPRLPKPELLLLAGLFHDIAKGRGGDHSELGAVDAREFCQTMGLSRGDTDLVAWLVQQHLLMSSTAQKQDIADPDVIQRFGEKVGGRERLDYLYLLTCADIAGTSPKLWNAWKDRLLADLYSATRAAFRRGLERAPENNERITEVQDAVRNQLMLAGGMMADEVDLLFERIPAQAFLRSRTDQLAWQIAGLTGLPVGATRVLARPVGAGDEDHAQALEVFVHSPDRDGLFAAIVATLDRLGLAIVRARIFDGPDASVFDSFEVLVADPARPVLPGGVERRLQAVLAAPLDQVRPSRRTQPSHLRHFRVAPQVAFMLSEDGRRTRLGIVCTDRPGLLADIAQVLRAQRLRVHDARIATFGERAEDVFQITDDNDQPLDSVRQEALREALLRRLDGENRQ